jgi:hypothetical protein
MFEFCNDCLFENVNSSSYVTVGIQIITLIFIVLTYFLARNNLNRLTRSHLIQSEMNLINLGFQLKKSITDLKISTHEYDQIYKIYATSGQNDFLIEKSRLEKDKALQLCLASADQLATLIQSDSIQQQFDSRDWERQYKSSFEQVLTITSGQIVYQSLTQNIDALLNRWNNPIR